MMFCDKKTENSTKNMVRFVDFLLIKCYNKSSIMLELWGSASCCDFLEFPVLCSTLIITHKSPEFSAKK